MSHEVQDSARYTSRRVAVSSILPLRWRVLRPGRPFETASFAGDDLPDTEHWAASDPDGAIVSVASLYRAGLPQGQVPLHGKVEVSWQLRGMATDLAFQGKGAGGQLIRAILQSFADRSSPGILWCNARERAVSFYERHGFKTTSQSFEIPGVGPHFVMQLQIGRAKPGDPVS